MSRQLHETFTNGQNDEHFKIIIVGGGLVIPFYPFFLQYFFIIAVKILFWYRAIHPF